MNVYGNNYKIRVIHSAGFIGATEIAGLGPNYKKILRLSYDVIITYDNRKSNLR